MTAREMLDARAALDTSLWFGYRSDEVRPLTAKATKCIIDALQFRATFEEQAAADAEARRRKERTI